MKHEYANMWVSNDGTHNVMCQCFEIFTDSKIGTSVRKYAEHIVKETSNA